MRQINVKKVGDKTLNFLFSYRAFSVCAKEMGIKTIVEFANRLQEIEFNDIPVILYAAYENACFYQHNKVEFTVEDANTWIDEIGFSDAMVFAVEMATSYLQGDQTTKEVSATAKKKKPTLK